MHPPQVLSQTVAHALRACFYIAQQQPRFVRVREVADSIRAPRNYLSKVLGQLARAGFLDSTRGPSGGFRLASGVEHRSLALMRSVFEASEPRRCLLGGGLCGHDGPCSIHQRWAPIATATTDFFSRTTIADLLSPPGNASMPRRPMPSHVSATLA